MDTWTYKNDNEASVHRGSDLASVPIVSFTNSMAQIIVNKLTPVEFSKMLDIFGPHYVLIGDLMGAFAKQQTAEHNKKQTPHGPIVCTTFDNFSLHPINANHSFTQMKVLSKAHCFSHLRRPIKLLGKTTRIGKTSDKVNDILGDLQLFPRPATDSHITWVSQIQQKSNNP
jgi:hypothetical protein